MEKKLILRIWGDGCILQDSKGKWIGTFKYAKNKTDYSLLFEKEIPAVSGPPMRELDLVENGSYLHKRDLQKKVYSASINYSKDISEKLGQELSIAPNIIP